MIRPLRAVALDLSTAATAIASTHTSTGEPRLSVRTIDTAKRPLHMQTDLIDVQVRQACGFGSGNRLLGRGFADLVVIEGTFSRQSSSDYPLHHVRACVTQWLARQGIPYVDVAPATVKVYATGSGATSGANKVTKDKVISAVIAAYGRLLHIPPTDDNCADAVTLLALGLDAYGQPLATMPDSHRRALNSVKWPKLDLSTAVPA
jgi:crossover junction endodeoxyribonuclease RuvC